MMYVTKCIQMMVVWLTVVVVTNGFTTNLPPRSTFMGVRTSSSNTPTSTKTLLYMNIETVPQKENIRVGVIGMLFFLCSKDGKVKGKCSKVFTHIYPFVCRSVYQQFHKKI